MSANHVSTVPPDNICYFIVVNHPPNNDCISKQNNTGKTKINARPTLGNTSGVCVCMCSCVFHTLLYLL